MPADATSENPRFNPLEALAGWMIPGLGHWLLGQRRRGIIIGTTILILWLAGVLIGGICVLDHRTPEETYSQRGFNYWFLAQGLLAPSVVGDFLFVRVLDAGAAPSPNNSNNRYTPSFGRVYEQGVLFTAMAGFLNLLAIIDVIYCDPNRRREYPPGAAPAPTKPAPSGPDSTSGSVFPGDRGPSGSSR